MTRLRRALVPAIAALALLAAPATTAASCMQPPAIEQAMVAAEIVFVGTVSSIENQGTWATIAVEEIWKGPDLPASILVKGGPGGNAATSVDRTFQVGVKYVFFPIVDPASGPVAAGALVMTDNACTSTTPWSDGLVALRPSDARAPLSTAADNSEFDVSGLVAPLGLAVLVAAVLLGIGLLARGRQSA